MILCYLHVRKLIHIYIYTKGDGVFDKLENKDVINAAWDAARRNFKQQSQSIHSVCG